MKPAATAAIALRETRGEVEDDRIREASGLAASRNHRGVLWVHNDSGDTSRVFAINTQGKSLGTFYLPQARARDWEDMAIGPGPEAGRDYLYIGDIGDNLVRRQQITVYRVPEPAVRPHQAPMDSTLGGVEAIVLTYPDGPQNSETLMVDPANGDLYLVTKSRGAQAVYRAPLAPAGGAAFVLERLAEVAMRGSVGLTQLAVGGDTSPSGRWTLLKSYDSIYRYENTRDPWYANDPVAMPYVPEPQGEAVAWAADESGYFTLSEEAGGVSAILYYYPLAPREGQIRSAMLRD